MSARLAWLALLFLSVPVLAGTLWLSRNGHYQVSFTSEIDPIVINRMHHWQLEITDRDGDAVNGAAVSVNGGMPAHDHGLPTRPQVTPGSAPGRYRLEGLRFHMGGRWEVELTIESDGVRDVTVITLDL
jgi:hypothetical protein